MTLVTSILQKGTNNHLTSSEEANKFTTNFVTPGVVGSAVNTSGVAPMTGAYAVNAAGTPNKTVIIGTGDAYVTATPSGQGSQTLNVTNNATITTTIADNATGAVRYDWIYLKVDPTAANNPAVNADDVATIQVNRSTSNVTDTVGAPAFNQPLAVVTVNNAFTTITNSNIADKRVSASAAIVDGSITTAKLAAAAVDATKLGTSAIFLGSATATANQTVTSNGTDVDLTGVTITLTIPSGGRSLLLYAYGCFDCASTSTLHRLKIKEGSTNLGESNTQEASASVRKNLHTLTIVSAPAAGSHTYKATYNNNQAGTGTLWADSTNKAIIVGLLV